MFASNQISTMAVQIMRSAQPVVEPGQTLTAKGVLIALILALSLIRPSPAETFRTQTPQPHDVPMFHNDDGLGLLQDCTFMHAIATGVITDIPTTVAGRSTSCLNSIKSIAQVMYSLQTTVKPVVSCLPSADLDWFDVLEFVLSYMENQPAESLAIKGYGVWIMQALNDKYSCQ